MKTSHLGAAVAALGVALLAACPAQSPPRPAPTCEAGEIACGGTCRTPTSFQSDPLNCGTCGLRCGIGTCSGGACNCEGATACAGQNPRCVDTQTDPGHCGGCDTPCTKPGQGCQGGVCGCHPPRPDDCGTHCTAWLTDPESCGTNASACGNVCPLTNDVCTAGVCACPAALPDLCPAATPTTCVNLASDTANCGACGLTCPTDATCGGGTCTCPGTAPQVCGGACVNTGSNERHCGVCGRACPEGGTCTSGSCTCPAARPTLCGSAPGTCCAGTGCCAGGTCQTAHANGLGQTYHDCAALDAHTHAQALLAADAWSPGGATTDPDYLCGDLSCLCREKGTAAAAVWCYGTGPLGGRVKLTQGSGANCQTAVCPFGGYQRWH